MNITRIKSIVPCIELCRTIPDGLFDGTVFIWQEPHDSYGFWDGVDANGKPTGGAGRLALPARVTSAPVIPEKRGTADIPWHPAPTLAESIAAAVRFGCFDIRITIRQDLFLVTSHSPFGFLSQTADTPEESALKLALDIFEKSSKTPK